MNKPKSTPVRYKRVERTGYRMRPSVLFTPPTKRDSIFFTLRARLTALFILVAMLPIGIQAIINNYTTQNSLRKAAYQVLSVSASQTAANVDAFIRIISSTINDEARYQEFIDLLSLPAEDQIGSPELASVEATLHTLYNQQNALNSHFSEYWVMDSEGRVAATTSDEISSSLFLGLDQIDPNSFKLLIEGGDAFISPVVVTKDGSQGAIYFASRISGENRAVLGILVAEYNTKALQTILANANQLAGEGSYAVLFDENLIRLAHGTSPGQVFTSVGPLETSEIDQLKMARRLPDRPASDLTTNLPELKNGLEKSSKSEFFTAIAETTTNDVFAVAAAPLQTRKWQVAFLQPQSVFLEPLQAQNRLLMMIAIGFLVLTGLVAVFTTRALTQPITRLTRAAERVTAGDLWIQAPEGKDEIGVLSATFNSMTGELRRTLEGLEQRVAERTSELAKASSEAQHRAKQLQTVAEVAHTIATIQESETLLKRVTELISERFSYYHVGIFLIDKSRKFAVLEAANSEGGQRMLERNHRLKVGQEGIVGFVTSEGQARIALDVGADAVYFDNPDLPYTRSEMALPLKVGDRVIGALDVQSMEQSAFSQEDIALLGTLADQVAIAIENVRLLSETQSALAELQQAHHEYLRDAWRQEVKDRTKTGYRYMYGRVIPMSSDEEIDQYARQGKEDVILLTPEGSLEAVENKVSEKIKIPISVRGQVIGMLNLGESGHKRYWSDEDLNLIREVSLQLGLALENARLIEQTQHRAEREHLVAEITSKLRASNDPQEIMETAARELRNALRAKRAQVVIPPARPMTETKPSEEGGDENEP